MGDVVPYKPFIFRSIHKTIINLESPVTKTGKPAEGKINLIVKENYLKEIFDDNLLAVNIGNNHILDYGKEGLVSTLNEIEKLGVKWFGIENIFTGNHNPLIIEYNSVKVAFIAVVCESTSPIIELDNLIHLSVLNLNEVLTRVALIRNVVDRVVVYIHWGVEESSYPLKRDIVTARKLIDAGVDLVIGSHAHAPQAIEKYKNGLIAYNLGNFIMPQMKRMPSYYDNNSKPQNTYNKLIMLWNRISWGFLVDMETLEYKIERYMFLGNRIIKLPFTPFDRFLNLKHYSSDELYDSIVNKHLLRRKFMRKIADFLHQPHVPQKLRRILWK